MRADLDVKVLAVDLSMRDLFAMHAPTEVPDWFAHSMPPLPPLPPVPDGLSERPLRDMAAYDSDREADVDPEDYAEPDRDTLRRWLAERNVAQIARARWRMANQEQRFIQWRWHYADQMLAAREPKE